MFFYHMVEIELVIYVTPEEAVTQLFHHDTSSNLQHAAFRIFFPPPLSSIYCISKSMILTQSSNTEGGGSCYYFSLL